MEQSKSSGSAECLPNYTPNQSSNVEKSNVGLNMDYEKAYNEAIERANNYEREYRSVLKRLMITIDRFREKRYICIDLNELESYFPELKGLRSDELKEKIKDVIRLSSASDGERICMIDWVETHNKQGEQK